MNHQTQQKESLGRGFNVYKTRIINRKSLLKTPSWSSAKVVPTLGIWGKRTSNREKRQTEKRYEKDWRETLFHTLLSSH